MEIILVMSGPSIGLTVSQHHDQVLDTFRPLRERLKPHGHHFLGLLLGIQGVNLNHIPL
jgi:hypothetical protein